MYAEEKIEFAVGYRTAGLEFHSERIELYEYDTVEQLKVAIHNAFDIPPHKQIIEGWKQVPEDDLTILQVCSNLNRINYLNVGILETENAGYNFTENIPVNNDNDEASDEIRATRSCFQKICTHIATSHVKFNIATLKHAKETVLLAPPQTRKVILLYLHNSKDKFSNIFLRKLNSPRISEILIQSFYVLGWDVENDSFHRALTKVLVETDLEHLSALIQTQTCAAILLQNINGTIKVLSLLIDDKPEEDTFYMCLKNCHDYLTVDHNMTVRTDSAENNDIDAAKFQRLMADMLGDRDYDCFAFDQHEFLKQKIGYALFGQPTEQEDGQGKYKEKDKKRIDIIYEAIKKHSNKFAEYKDQVEISFIYNVMEPLDKEKVERARKIENYNPNTDISPVPIFVLRKCRETEGNACRIFIDDTGRVYDTWKGYLEDNKLPKCNMVLPENGRYEVIGQDVLLERHKSPECNISKSFLKAGDIGSAIGGVGSGTVLVGAGIASITLAPAAIIAAGVVGGVAGVYALGRSAAGLVDRLTHDEDMSIMNSEARGIYFNLLAGTLGFAGAGANLAVSQLAARGFNIGQGVGAVVNTIGVANMGVSGASIINSGYDVFDQWYNDNQTPSLLTIVQLSSSILFFGNAVYNFRTCQTIVEESQTKVLQEYQDSLRSNRHRKTFNKMMKETIRRNDGNQVRGKAETIKTIRNIPNKDEMFAALTRNNKLMNKNGVRFFASNGEITLNGQTVNMNEFVSMNRQQANAFLSNLPTETNISISDTTSLINDFSLNRFSLPTVDVEFCARYALRLIGVFGIDVRKMLMQVVDDVLNAAMRFFKDILDELFPKHPKFTNILNVVMEYFGGKAADYLQKYYKWRSTGSPYYYDRGFVDIPQDRTARYVWIFEKVVKVCFLDGHLVEYELRDIIKYLEIWLVNKLFEDQQNEEATQRKLEHSPQPARSVTCKVCAGKFFKGD